MPNLYHERGIILQQRHRQGRSSTVFSKAATPPQLAERALFLLQAGRRHTLAHPAQLLSSSGAHT
ncbi:hypothetical protein PWG14_08195 (plasmid) [Chromobacterium amazonense]|uniref:hypothetical protein n=1 Tax=Chromobacterium amazonense TaxID=1382803 RepID=UPI00237D70CF|nr:hypothetical protein [Chromobacterium amazonense]MDE1712666.1 hypothetical protein [Chromobacterium amazonense]